MKFISFYTICTPYQNIMFQKLLPSLERWNLDYDIEGINDLGDWFANTSFKAEFILNMLNKHKQDVCFLDADATIEKYPELLFTIPEKYDVACHFLDWCYSEDTQVYTDQGWKFFKDLNKTEKVATLNSKNQQLEFQRPIRYIQEFYTGEMHHYIHSNVDLLVTPNHNMLYIPDSGRKEKEQFKFKTSNELFKNQRFKLFKGCNWKGNNIKYFTLPAYKNDYGNNGNIKYRRSSKKIPIELWIQFLAWYLSEGSVSTGMINIGQAKTSLYTAEIKYIMKKMSTYLNCKYSIYDYPNKVLNHTLFSTQLVDYLKQFGKAKEKYIPKDIKLLSSSLLKLFLNTYIKGDGSFTERGYAKIFTASTNMKNDLEEIILKAGYSSSVRITTSGFGKPIYNIGIKSRIASIRRQYKEIISYSGYVYCVELLKNHTLYVRRVEGKHVWSGNCLHWRNQPGQANRELLSGTMVFRYNPKVLALMEIYIEECKNSPKVWEQKILQEILAKDKTIKIYNLPASYCAVVKFDNKVPEYIGEPVVVHWQASRRFKKKP